MNAVEFARVTYKEFIDSLPESDVPHGLRKALKSHERVPLFIDNLAREISKLPKTDRETLKQCVHDMTRIFINAAKTARDQKMLSVMAKLSLEAQIEKRKRFIREAEALDAKGADYVTSEKGLEQIHTRTEVTEEDLQ